MCVCVCVCVCVRTYPCIWGCACTCVCMVVDVSVYLIKFSIRVVFLLACMSMHLSVCMYTYSCMSAYLCIYTHVCICLSSCQESIYTINHQWRVCVRACMEIMCACMSVKARWRLAGGEPAGSSKSVWCGRLAGPGCGCGCAVWMFSRLHQPQQDGLAGGCYIPCPSTPDMPCTSVLLPASSSHNGGRRGEVR